MKTNVIILMPDRLSFPLAPCAVGKLSSAVLTVAGDIPDDIEEIAVAIEYDDDGVTKRYTAAGTRQADGTYRVYLAPVYFPESSETLKYHVIGADANGNPRWLGTGNLRIIDNPAAGGGVMPDILPRDTFVYSPTDHLYHQVIVEFDDDGFPHLSVDREGVQK